MTSLIEKARRKASIASCQSTRRILLALVAEVEGVRRERDEARTALAEALHKTSIPCAFCPMKGET